MLTAVCCVPVPSVPQVLFLGISYEPPAIVSGQLSWLLRSCARSFCCVLHPAAAVSCMAGGWHGPQHVWPPLAAAEYCARGSLFDVLRSAALNEAAAASLTWPRRLRMALDAAKGMLALHSHEPPIIHRCGHVCLQAGWGGLELCQLRCAVRVAGCGYNAHRPASWPPSHPPRDLKSPNLLVDGAWRVKVSPAAPALETRLLARRPRLPRFARTCATSPRAACRLEILIYRSCGKKRVCDQRALAACSTPAGWCAGVGAWHTG